MAFADKFITIMEGGYAGAVSTVPLHIMVHAIEFRYLKSPRATFFFKRLGSSLGAPPPAFSSTLFRCIGFIMLLCKDDFIQFRNNYPNSFLYYNVPFFPFFKTFS